MWLAVAEYADGSSVKRYFADNGKNDSDQQYEIECWLIERRPECTYYSVVWVQ